SERAACFAIENRYHLAIPLPELPMSRPLIALLLASLFAPALQAAELVVYTERREPLVKPLFERYERETGTTIRVLSDGAPVLIERLAAEGANTRADVFMAVDAGNLWQAA